MILKYRKASFLYEIFDKYEAGLILTGEQAKAIRNNNCNFTDPYITLDPATLLNLTVDSKSTPIKLLLNKRELVQLKQKLIKGFTIIPLDLHYTNGKVKCNIALARGKKVYDKKQQIKEKEILRSL